MSIFGASWVFAAVLGSGVSSGVNRAGRGHVGACLVWMSESVAIPAVCSGVCRVDWGDFPRARKYADGSSDSFCLFFRNRNNDRGGGLLGSGCGVRLEVTSGFDGNVGREMYGGFHCFV